jgi:hypothetical protein
MYIIPQTKPALNRSPKKHPLCPSGRVQHKLVREIYYCPNYGHGNLIITRSPTCNPFTAAHPAPASTINDALTLPTSSNG